MVGKQEHQWHTTEQIHGNTPHKAAHRAKTQGLCTQGKASDKGMHIERESYSNDNHIWWSIGFAEALRQVRQGKHSM
jgi:hypothetical protein